MALNWNMAKIHNWKEVNTTAEWPVTDAIIWYTWLCGVELSNEANAEKLYGRISRMEKQDGSRLMSKGKPSYITLEDVKRRIGLTTNGGRKTETEFKAYLKRLKERSLI